ncbi:MAG: hypothetical protein HZA31_07925 [Opitutae bacterium]|nr:hypothetical protein [Opitutae bacterium]
MHPFRSFSLALLILLSTHSAFAARYEVSGYTRQAIQTAINSACSAGGAQEVFLPAGIYVLDGELTLGTGTSRQITITGEGTNITSLSCTASNSNGFNFNFASSSETVTFLHLTILANTSCANAIKVTFPTAPADGSTVVNFKAENVHIRNQDTSIFSTGICLEYANYATLLDCHIATNRGGSGSGLLFSKYCPNSTIKYCNFFGHHDGILFAQPSSAAVAHKNILIYDSMFIDVYNGITYSHSDAVVILTLPCINNLIFKNNHIDARGSWGSAILLNGGLTNSQIKGNYIIVSEGAVCSCVIRGTSNNIENNLMNGMDFNGQIVLYKGSSGNYVISNTFRACPSSLFLQELTTNNLIGGNHSYAPTTTDSSSGRTDEGTNNTYIENY